jgi:carbamoyltransferase
MSPVQGAKQRVNEIKQREDYRPFGASILKGKERKYFTIDNSPYMLYSCTVKDDRLKEITHVDGSCRPQTVDHSNPVFQELLHEVEKLTGLPLLLNTSLNIQGKPICGSIEQAKQIKGLDNLVIGNERY